MQTDHFCAVKGSKIDETACASIIYKADAATLEVCGSCERGKALADTVGSCRVAKPANEQPVRTKSPWQMVVEATGHTSQGRLADALRTTQSKISQTFIKLGKGKLPSGPVWNDLLQLSGISAAELFAAATGKPLPQQTTPEPAASEQEMPAASEAVNADLPPLSQHLLDVAELAAMTTPDVMSLRRKRIAIGAEETAGETPPTLMGADPSEQLLTSGELFALRRHDAPQQAPAPAGIPDGFELYEPFSAQTGQPVLSIGKGSEASISADAVRRFGLAAVPCVHLLFNRGTGQVGIKPLPRQAEHALKLQSTRKSQARCVSMRGMWRKLGIQPNPGIYPLTQDPSGLIVATISQQPSQGGEA